jgi:magnesium-transporting ATPase (P-type)
MIAAIISGAIGDIEACIVLFIVVVRRRCTAWGTTAAPCYSRPASSQFVNAGIGFVQEVKALRAVDALSNLTVPQVRPALLAAHALPHNATHDDHRCLVQALVVRDGAQQMVPSEELVPGDIVVLEEGVWRCVRGLRGLVGVGPD